MSPLSASPKVHHRGQSERPSLATIRNIPAQRAGMSTEGGKTSANRLTGTLGRVRAWMFVLPVDFAMLLGPLVWSTEQAKATIAMAVLSILLLCGGGRYRARLHLSVLDEMPTLVTRVLTAAAAVAVVIALRHEQESVTAFMASAGIVLVLLLGGRVVTTLVINWSRRRRITAHRTVIVGGGAVASELTQILGQHSRYGLDVVGFVDDGQDSLAESLDRPRLGGIGDLDRAVATSGTDVILIADGEFSERHLLDIVRSPMCMHCDVLVVPRMHHFHTQTGSADHIGSIPVMRIRTPNLRGPARAIKRLFDIVVSGLTLLLIAPVMLACAVAVRLEGGPGVIFRQPRVGRDGAEFDCLKFRSMRPANESESATNWSVANDKRVGPVGRVLRRTSLDELPQLWNILRGDMALVGPRPERPHFVDKFSAEFDRYAHRHRVVVGLTGLAQVSGLRGDTSIADRARYDNYYIEHWSLWLDIKIIVRTFSEVLFARGR